MSEAFVLLRGVSWREEMNGCQDCGSHGNSYNLLSCGGRQLCLECAREWVRSKDLLRCKSKWHTWPHPDLSSCPECAAKVAMSTRRTEEQDPDCAAAPETATMLVGPIPSPEERTAAALERIASLLEQILEEAHKSNA